MVNNELDELFEKLTSKKLLIQAKSPPFGGYNGANTWYSWSWTASGFDIEYKNAAGKRHRIWGPAYISKKYDIEIWYKNGEYHRENGPAITHKNNFLWYYGGKLHNLQGPAIDTGGGPKQYWINGQKLSPKEYKKEIARRIRKGLIK